MLEIKIKTGGAAFRDPNTGEEDEYYEQRECANLLEGIAYSLRDGIDRGAIMDSNGNKVGTWSL